jgi:tetratricopeptide (TPR) repeat protein
MTSPGAAGNYPGNPSLPVEVREKILMTFRHALGLFSSGHVSDCLIGCEFILKMDPRFTPARRLQEKARNRNSDVDISELQAIASGEASAAPAAAPPSQPKAAPAVAVPTPPRAEKPDPERLAAEAAARLSQRDYDGAITMASRVLALAPGNADALAVMEKAAGRKATKPLVDASQARGEQAAAEGRIAEARLELERIRALDPENPAIAALETRLASPGASPEPAPEAAAFTLDRPESGAPGLDTPEADDVSSHPASFTEIGPPEGYSSDSFSLEPPSAGEEALVPPPPPTSELFVAPEGSSGPANFLDAPVEDEESQAADREIARLLKQGDEVSAKGDRQQAIEVWSRVFLIDINNAAAVTRIEKARQEMAEEGRMVAELLKKGRESFEAGDREAARQFFRQAQALDPDEATARFYLERIEQEASAAAAASAGPAQKAAGSPLPLEEDLLPAKPATAPPPPAPRKAGFPVNPRVLGLIGAFLLLTMVGVYFVFKGGRSPEPAAKVASSGSAPRARDQAAKDEHTKGGPGDASRAAVEPVGGAGRESKSDADPARLRAAGEKALGEKRYIEALKNFNLAAPAFRDDPTFTQQQGFASEKVTALTPAVKLYNEGEYETAIPILWRIVQEDRENRDARSYLLRAYYNQGVTQLQNGLYPKAMQAFQEALALDPNDSEAARHRKFAERYQKGDLDLLGRIYVRHLSHRP